MGKTYHVLLRWFLSAYIVGKTCDKDYRCLEEKQCTMLAVVMCQVTKSKKSCTNFVHTLISRLVPDERIDHSLALMLIQLVSFPALFMN